MKVKTNVQLKGPDGEILKGDGRPLTVGSIAINSLLTPIQSDDEKAKLEKYEVYKKIRDAKTEVDLKIDEVALVKKVVGKVQPQLLMGQIWEELENSK